MHTYKQYKTTLRVYDYMPYLCRTVYDGDESEAFLESLNSRIKVHDKDIERMCNKNYQGFIESVSELLKVKSDAAKLKVTGRLRLV